MVQEAQIQQVASFQVFVRDNKPKMNAYYPFLSQEQIMLKLRQRWKQLDDSKRQPYCKLVLSRKKVKTVKVKVVKITRRRIPKGKQIGTSKNVTLARNDDNFGFDCSGDSYINSDYELDSVSEHSPFMCNKLAIDSLKPGLCPATNKPTVNVKKGAVRKTDESGVVGLQYDVPRVRSESMVSSKTGILQTPWGSSKTGILQTPCKKRCNFQGRVSFSAVTETANNRSSCEFDEEDIYEDINEDIDDDVLYIESNRKTKMNTSDGNTYRDKSVAADMPSATNLQKVEDHSWMPCTQGNPASRYSPAVGELGMQESKKRKLNVKTPDINTPVTSSKSTSSRFSRRRRNLPPAVSLNLDGRSLHRSSTAQFNERSEIVSEFCKKENFSAKNNMTYVERKGQSFFSESPNLSPGVKVQSCIYDSGNILKHDEDELRLSSFIEGADGNFKSGHRSKGLKNKADVNRNNLSVKSGTHVSDCGANECFTRFSRRAITLSHQPTGFDCPQSTKSCVQSTGTKSCVQSTGTKSCVQSTGTKSYVQSTGTKSCVQSTGLKNDSSDEACLKTNTVKISPKVTSGFSGKDADWKDDNNFSISNGKSDSDFGDRSTFYKDGTVRKAVSHTGKETASPDEANLKTSTRKKSEINTNPFGRESNICKRKVDSDEENDNEFDDTDGCYTNDIVSTRLCQLRKQVDSAVDSYLINSTMKKYEKLPFDFCEREINIHKGKVGKNYEASDNEFDDKDSCYKDIVYSVPRQTGKKADSTIETYPRKSRMRKCEKMSEKKCDNHRKIADNSDEENNLEEVIDKDSFFRDDVDKNAQHNRSKRDTTEACSKRSTLKEAERTISDLTRKHADIYKACDEDNKKFDNVVDDCENYVAKKVTSIKSINTLWRKNDSHTYNENNSYQANRVTDALAVYANNTTKRNSEISKGKILDKFEQLKHMMVTKNKVKQGRDKTFVKHGSDIDVVEVVEDACSKTKNSFPRKDSKSVQNQKNKPRFQNQKKSAITQKSTSSNHVGGNNKGQQSHENTSDNYSVKNPCLPSASLKYKLFQHESHLKNSSTQHAHKLGGAQSPSRKETPNYEVKKINPASHFSSGSIVRVQRRLFSDVNCRKTSDIGRSKKFKMENKNISIMDSINKPQVSWKDEDICNSDMSNKSFGSETNEDEEKHQDDFLVNMANQTTTALLQAIDRLKNLTSPPMNLAEEWLPDGVSSELPEPEDIDLPSECDEQQDLGNMFQDITPNVRRAYLTPAQQTSHRLLASSATETPSNFMAMFDDGGIFL